MREANDIELEMQIDSPEVIVVRRKVREQDISKNKRANSARGE